MSNQVFRHFFAGFVRLHILYHADKEPICGVEIMEELKRHGYDVSAGTIYPILHALEKGGFLASNSAVVSGKRRKNYRITRDGRKVLKQAKQQVRELVSEVIEDKDLLTEAKRRGKSPA